MKLKLLSHSLLMEESWTHVGAVAESGAPLQQQIASRVLDEPTRWRHWESEHSAFMHDVAGQPRAPDQLTALRRLAFTLIHRKALFEYLRASDGPGRRRHQVLALFYEGRDPANALLAEHSTYLRAACSHWCATHLGSRLMGDGIFLEPIEEYETLYAEYFESYCRCALTRRDDPQLKEERSLLPFLKYQLDQRRRAILMAPRVAPEMLDDARIRKATGDTLVLPPLPAHDVQLGRH